MAAYNIDIDRFFVLVDPVNDSVGVVHVVLIEPLVRPVESLCLVGNWHQWANSKIFVSDTVDLFALGMWKLFQPRAGSLRSLNRVVGDEWRFCQFAMRL